MPNSKLYRPDIDGLRAVAVILVLIFHAFPEVVPGGFIGVDVFFVISGFLITGIILRELEAGSFSVANFYVRRIRRIFPALITILSVTLVLGWFFFLPNEFISLGRNVYAGALFFPNLMLLSEVGYFDTAAQLKPLLHLWSLGIEEQFYFAFPLFLIFVWRQPRILLAGIIALAIASFALNMALLDTHPSATFYLPITRGWELMVGAFLALPQCQTIFRTRSAVDAHIRAILGVTLLYVASAHFTAKVQYPGWLALFPVFGTALLIISETSFLSKRALSSRPFVFVGLISYPLYLWHWPLLSFFGILAEQPTATLKATTLIASVLLAYLTYRFIELPIRSGSSFRMWKVTGLSTAMATMCACGLLVVSTAGYPPRLSAALANAGILNPAFDSLQKSKCLIDSFKITKFPTDCVDDSGSGPLLLLWGDSTAGALAPGFRKLQTDHEFRFGQLVTSSCWPILNYDVPGVPNCRKMNDQALAIIQMSKPDVVVLEGIWSTAFENIGQTVAKLKALNVKKVVVLGRVPVWNLDLPTAYLKFYLLHGETLPIRRSRIYLDSDWTDAVIKKQVEVSGGEFVSTYAAICDHETCLTRAGDKSPNILTRDRLHLTEAGSIFVVSKIAKDIFRGVH